MIRHAGQSMTSQSGPLWEIRGRGELSAAHGREVLRPPCTSGSTGGKYGLETNVPEANGTATHSGVELARSIILAAIVLCAGPEARLFVKFP